MNYIILSKSIITIQIIDLTKYYATSVVYILEIDKILAIWTRKCD